MTPIHFLERTARIWPTKLAVVHGDRRYDYKEMDRRVRHFASALLDAGLKPGDRVAFICPNTPSILEGHFAVPLAGGVLICVNTRLKNPEVEYILKHAGARFAIIDRDSTHLASVATAAGVERVIIDHDTGSVETSDFEKWIEASPMRHWWSYPGWNLKDENDLMSICYTSGTTGNPKGVMHSYRSCFLQALFQNVEMQFDFNSVYLWILPLFHANGWCLPWSVVMVGATNICLRKVDYDLIWQYFTKEGVTHYNGAPTVQTFIVNNPNAVKVPRKIKAMVAGSPPSPTLIEQLTAIDIDVLHVYGMTETYGPCARAYPQLEFQGETDLHKIGQFYSRQGQNYVGQDEVRVVDTAMNDVPLDGKTQGEVVFRGNITMLGYYNDPQATEKAFAGGWLHSGDVAVRHQDGYIELKDRMKDIIISGGENISTIEVENVIAKFHKVLEVAVVPTPDDMWGERPKAYVVLKKEFTEHESFEPGELEQEIIQHCRQHLAGFKVPAVIQLELDLPKTSTGKIQKFVLREREWQGRGGRRIN
ncbi:AMP-dependent synthetase and ligase [Gonapodya prolifera JEL478]|uniref:AMP-dependent synthetase and ligase n=1 Tax=Gonapodya prolifera (strain JEL478) TaxID=1344416 RepID=A0A138ZY09_GONPJ|nr:AMP-dependent synthetase and ligase [Gonapodya prolifera JEL478]|eukprot:KXS09379.1 AMP-dependent synthetase and ligase [Gonapodya prolifera JEL478]